MIDEIEDNNVAGWYGKVVKGIWRRKRGLEDDEHRKQSKSHLTSALTLLKLLFLLEAAIPSS